MNEPIPVMVRRYECPHCHRRRSSKAATTEHIGRCWLNPEARACKTCKHYDAPNFHGEESCAAGVSLAGRPPCDRCGGFGDVPADAAGDFGMTECPDCAGDGFEIKAGPIVNCDDWEAA